MPVSAVSWPTSEVGRSVTLGAPSVLDGVALLLLQATPTKHSASNIQFRLMHVSRSRWDPLPKSHRPTGSNLEEQLRYGV